MIWFMPKIAKLCLH